MFRIKKSNVFNDWLARLRDQRAKGDIIARIGRLAEGNPGDVKGLKNGLSEMRIHTGPGYRVYYMKRGKVLIVLLCGGDKSTQDRDIKQAHKIAETWKEEE